MQVIHKHRVLHIDTSSGLPTQATANLRTQAHRLVRPSGHLCVSQVPRAASGLSPRAAGSTRHSESSHSKADLPSCSWQSCKTARRVVCIFFRLIPCCFICYYFPPFCRLSFHLAFSFLHCVKAFKFN